METKSKHQAIRELLAEAIKSGEFAAGEQLPPEHALAVRYGVSYMTARRAVTELVEADIVERRGNKGTYVRRVTPANVGTLTINLITSAYEGSHQTAFLRHGTKEAASYGCSANVIRLTDGQQDAAVRVLTRGEYAIVLLDEVRPTSSLGVAMRAARMRTVSLYPDLSDDGITSIQTDLSQTFKLAHDRLKAAGHHKIAVVTQTPSYANPNRQVKWEGDIARLLGTFAGEFQLIKVRTPVFESPARQAYAAVSQFLLDNRQATALITHADELAHGALAACRDAGRSVPEELSLINLGDSTLMEFSSPPVTCIDVDFGAQVRLAIEKLLQFRDGTAVPGGLQVNEPRLVERRSVVIERQINVK